MSNDVKSLVIYPDSRLRVVPQEVTEFNDELKDTVKELVAALARYRGAGLAGPQIGIPLKIFAIDATVCSPNERDTKVFINPTIVANTTEVTVGKEGCLSFPGVYLDVARPTQCVVDYYNENGERSEIIAAGFYARAVQHENDHLNGKLFVDFISYFQRERVIKKMKRLKNKHGL